ncbi:hypothetical protein CKO51_00980 [Rhodopirellula sp. SM50]|nr:hypothetical protein CKO51_00980 [Rhodopirellula sp. SM50]
MFPSQHLFSAGLVTPECRAVHGAGLTRETTADLMLRAFGLANIGAGEQDVVKKLIGQKMKSSTQNQVSILKAPIC